MNQKNFKVKIKEFFKKEKLKAEVDMYHDEEWDDLII